MITLKTILEDLEFRTPVFTAEKWDNVGLLVGDPKSKIKGAVCSVDLTQESIDVAHKKGYNLIVNHHPCIFKGLSKVTAQGASNLVYQAAKKGIAVYSTHTNFDQCALEVPLAISHALGITPQGRLFDDVQGSLLKLAVFVPESHVDEVRQALCQAGAGVIGNYDHCTFSSSGEGTFRGQKGSNPFLGRPGKLERAKEQKLETILPRGLKNKVLTALRASHPYEEIAYDLYRVEQEPAKLGMISGLGYGFYGDLKKPESFESFAKKVKKVFGVKGYLLTNPAPKKIKRIGFVAGKGASFANCAHAMGCDLFITGETGYHVARESAQKGLAIMELGHRESELFFLKITEGWLKKQGLKVASLNTPLQTVRF